MGDPSGSEGQVHSSSEHISIDMARDTPGLVSSIKKKMEDISSIVFIIKVPPRFRDQNESIYTPNKVSIGPLHRGRDALKEMENHKWRYLNALLSRKSNPEASLDRCVKVLVELEHRTRNCYGEKFDLTGDEFVQMLLVDGAFIIELFLRYAIKGLRRPSDPIFAGPLLLRELRCDMLLLENQVPFSVLQELFKTLPIPEKCNQNFDELAFKFFAGVIPGDQRAVKERFCQEGYHLLDLIRHCMLPTDPKEKPEKEAPPEGLENARKLRRGGIKLRNSRAKSLLDVKFSNGVLSVPHLRFHQCLEKLLWNLIVFEEELHFDDAKHITSYARLVACLIRSPKDVKLLGQRRILGNLEDKQKDIENVFGKIREKVKIKDSYYSRLFEQVNEYKRVPLTSSRKWDIILILLLFLTFVGTFFSALSFSLHY